MESAGETPQKRADGMDSGVDLDAARTTLSAWLAERGEIADGTTIGPLTVPGGSGSTNHTLLFDVPEGEASDHATDGLVARVKPEVVGYHRDLFEAEFRVLDALSSCPEVPTPAVIGFERDTSLLGGEFFVMERIAGQVANDNPPFNVEGFLKDATPEQRQRLWRNAVTAMATLHKSDPGDLSFLELPELAESPVAQELELWCRAIGDDPGRHPALDPAADWLRANLPADAQPGLAWGDARIGNMIFDDFECRAIIDWDQVSLAGSRNDLAYWILMEETWPGPRLDGFGDRAETIAIWEQVTGESAGDLHWHDVFACFRLCVVMSIHMARVEAHTSESAQPAVPEPEPAEEADGTEEPDYAELASPLRIFSRLEELISRS